MTAEPRVPYRHACLAARTLRAGVVLAVVAGLPAGLVAQGIPVTVGVGASQSGVGSFDLPVTVDMSARTEKLGSFVLTLRWNPAVVQLAGGVEGSFGQLTVNEDSAAAGVLRMSGVNPAGAGGLITLGVGRFTVIANDSTTFRVSVQELYAAGTFADLTGSAVPIDRLFCGSAAGTYGDVNRDDAVNGADALIVLTESVGLDVSQYAMGLGDVDSNGVRNPRDALIILSYAVGLNTDPYVVGQTVGGTVCVPPVASSHGINPTAAQALVGQEVRYFAYALDDAGAALALRNVTWTSSSPTVATVDANGMATALAAGSATISALQNDTIIGQSALTVVTGRPVHWVDALAVQARNQLGSAALPFGTLADAVTAAAAGDTVRVRSGRYEGTTIDRSLTLVGDTTAGGARPVLVVADPTAVTPTVLTLTTTAVRVELRDLQVDTASAGITAMGVDTVVLRHVDVRAGGAATATVAVDTAGLLQVDRTRLFGRPRDTFYSTNGLEARVVHTVAVDSSLVSDFSTDGIQAYLVDSLAVRGSTLRDNGYTGLRILTVDTTRATRLVFSRNRVIQNQYYGVFAQYLRRALFDHNVFVGAGYYGDGMYLMGTRSAVLSLLGDSLDVQGSQWLYAAEWDSVRVDSVAAVTTDYGANITGIRTAVITNGDFNAGYYDAFYLAGRGVDSTTILVRNSRFRGFSNQSYYSGYALEAYQATLDVRDVAFSDLYWAVYGSYARTRVAHSTFQDTYYAVYLSCPDGESRVDSTRIERSYQGVYAYGCGTAARSLVADSLEIIGGTYGIQTDYLQRTRVRQSRLQGQYYGIDSYGNDTVTVDTTALAPLYSGVNTSYDSLSVLTGNTVSCPDNQSAYGFEVFEGNRAVIRGNTITGRCYYGIYTSSRDTAEIRGNAVSGGGLRGLYGYVNDSAGQLLVIGNTFDGAYSGGTIYTDAQDGLPLLIRVDSNAVSNGVEAGVFNYQGDTVLVRDNNLSGIRAGSYSITYDAAISIPASAASRKRLEIVRNRITGSARGISVDRAINDTLTPTVVDTNRIVGSDSVGIRVGSYTRILARHNAIESSGLDGVRVDRSIAGDTLHVVLANNSFTGNAQWGVNNLDGGLIDARGNWWGDPGGPGNLETGGDFYSGGVLYDPWLQAAPVLLPPAPPVATAPLSAGTAATLLPPARPVATLVPPEPRAAAAALADGRADELASVRASLAAERRVRQEQRIREYRLQVERRAAREAELARNRKERDR